MIHRFFIILGIIGMLLPSIVAADSNDATYLMYERQWDLGVVIILVHGDDINTYGTGFWVSKNTIVTARHVVFPNGEQADRIIAIKGGWSSEATILYEDEDTDIAILTVDSMPREHYIFRLKGDVERGDDIIVVGYPWQVVHLVGYNLQAASLYPRANWGKVTWINPLNNYVVEFSAGTDQGNSGGPVIDVKTGGVVGLVSFALDNRGVEYATFYFTASSELIKALDELGISYSTVGQDILPLPDSNLFMLALFGIGLIMVLVIITLLTRK